MDAASQTSGRAGTDRGERPAISVVVPCYNGGRFLDGFMTSIAKQTFQNFEIIIVDDGSNEPASIAKFAELEKAGSARIIHQENRGMSGARNTGIRAARADLILVLDCDDMVEPPFLSEAVAILRTAPANVGAVFSHKRLVGAGHGELERHFNRFDLLFTNTMPSCLLLRKSCLDAIGPYDETLRDGYEDWEFNLRLAFAGFDAVEIPKPYHVYRVSEQGMLFSRSSAAHARLWRAIRRKHAALYRPWTVLKVWWTQRGTNAHVSLQKALAAYLMTLVLPDKWFTYLVVGLRRRHLIAGHRPAYTGQAPVALNAVKHS
jgi:glycosyltransferase involved in cell wall biosynthesis